jgi:integrase
VRFVLVLALGTCHGETLGLKWSRLNPAAAAPEVGARLRRSPGMRGEVSQDGAVQGGLQAPQAPALPTAVPAGLDQSRPLGQGGGLVDVTVTSRAGRRGITLPDELFDLLMQHREAQRLEQIHTGTEWQADDWMFAQPNGRPIGPEQNRREWLALLENAGVRSARLHDARHRAATVLLLLGIPERAVMDFMGWSHRSMAKRYQHVTGPLRHDIAERISSFLWGPERFTAGADR